MGITQHINFTRSLFSSLEGKKNSLNDVPSLYDIVKTLKSVGEYYATKTMQSSTFPALRL